jgi:hypothetical protein
MAALGAATGVGWLIAPVYGAVTDMAQGKDARTAAKEACKDIHVEGATKGLTKVIENAEAGTENTWGSEIAEGIVQGEKAGVK